MNKIIQGLCQLRDAFLSSSSNQFEMLKGLMDYEDLKAGTLTDGLGRAISLEESEGNYSLSILEKGSRYASNFTQVFSGSESQLRDYISEVIDSGNIHIGPESGGQRFFIKDFFQSVGHGADLNAALGALSDQFSTCGKVNTQDLVSLIDTYNLDSVSRNQLVNMLSAASSDKGYISNANFLLILQNMTSKAQDSLNDGEIAMDTTETRYVDNYLSTFIGQIAGTITSLIGMLLTAVNAVLGIVVSAIGALVSNIFNALTNALPGEVSVIDYSSSTDWFEAPSTAKVDNSDIAVVARSSEDIAMDSVAILNEGIWDTCLFLDSTGHLSWNRFVSLNLDRDKAWNKLASMLNVTKSSDNNSTTYTFIFKNSFDWSNLLIPLDCYLTDESKAEVESYTQREFSNYIISCFGAYCGFCVMQYMMQNNLNTLTVNTNYGDLDLYEEILANSIASTAEQGDVVWNRILNFINVWLYVNGSGWYHDFDNDTLTTITLQENSLTTSNQRPYFHLYGNSMGSQTFSFDRYNFTLPSDLLACPNNYLSHYLEYNNNVWTIDTNLYEHLYHLSTIPTERKYRFAGYSETKLVVFTAIVATITAVALVAGTIASKAIKKHKWKKMMSRKADLQNVKANYDNGLASLDDLYKAQKKYNFKAKIFGWDTYDAANDWWDSPTSDSPGDSIDVDRVINLIAG